MRGTKKQQTAKGLLLKIGVFPISFMGCIYMAEELLNWLSLWPPNFVSSLFSLRSSLSILPSIPFPIFR